MKVLVTGGAGFIGSHVVDACVQAGHQVIIIDDLSTGKRENVNPKATLHVVSLCDAEGMEKVFEAERPEMICHLAAKANVRESMVEPVLYAEVNVIGSLNLLQLARKYETKKIVYASTGGAVYGEPEYVPVDENHPINPLDPYGASKHHVEHYLYIYRKHFGIDYVILRFPNVYGPRQDPYGEAGVVAIWTNQMLNGGHPIINGSGEQERDFVYVGDIARANVLSLTHGSGAIINLGSSLGTSINEVFWLLKEFSGSDCEEQHAPAKMGEVSRTFLKADRAKEILGWEPQVSLRDGLEKTIDFFRH